jgi:hypothetical protein
VSGIFPRLTGTAGDVPSGQPGARCSYEPVATLFAGELCELAHAWWSDHLPPRGGLDLEESSGILTGLRPDRSVSATSPWNSRTAGYVVPR